jgi:hypothetical protein
VARARKTVNLDRRINVGEVGTVTTARLAALLHAALCAGCAHHQSLTPGQLVAALAGAAKVYTLTKLHPDGERLGARRE